LRFRTVGPVDAGERAALTALAQGLVPAALGAIAPVFLIPDPILWTAISAAAVAAASYPAVAPLSDPYGLCGGMAYSAPDHWNTRVPIARGSRANDQPARTGVGPTAIRNSLWQRLIDSLVPGGVLQRTMEWSLLLNQIPKEFSGGAEGLRNRTLVEWDRLRSRIDSGTPWPIGLIFTSRDAWYQHQILTYGYENNGRDRGKLFVYDSNDPFQFGSRGHHEVSLDFRGPTLSATGLSGTGALAGFFCSNYFPSVPVGMSKAYGDFLSWTGDGRAWMVTDGARMPIAGAAEMSALGGSTASVRPTGVAFATSTVRPRDGALFRERSSTAVVLFAGGAPFPISDTMWLDRFGGAGRVRVVPDNTIAAFNGLPEGTLLREWSDARVWRIMSGVRRWVRTPDELNNWGPLPVEPVRSWSWLNMGRPQGANIRTVLGTVTVMDSPTAPQRPHVFMEGTDANLWCRYSTGTDWAWTNMGRPQGANITGVVGAVSVMDTLSSPQRAHLFVTGSDGHLWCRWSTGTDWHWLNMGQPQGANIRSLLGAVTVMDTPTSPQRPHVFVEGNDADLWCYWLG
jgi:hypothetical protein